MPQILLFRTIAIQVRPILRLVAGRGASSPTATSGRAPEPSMGEYPIRSEKAIIRFPLSRYYGPFQSLVSTKDVLRPICEVIRTQPVPISAGRSAASVSKAGENRFILTILSGSGEVTIFISYPCEDPGYAQLGLIASFMHAMHRFASGRFFPHVQ